MAYIKPDYHYVLQRLYQDDKRTFGVLRDVNKSKILCYTLEDIGRFKKKWGETRIWSGVYKIKLRKIGRLHQKYGDRFYFHRGMLWLQEVYNFKYIYLHIGNTEKDTAGCILLGDAIGRKSLLYSTNAYRRVYKDMIENMKSYNVYITVRDEN